MTMGKMYPTKAEYITRPSPQPQLHWRSKRRNAKNSSGYNKADTSIRTNSPKNPLPGAASIDPATIIGPIRTAINGSHRQASRHFDNAPKSIAPAVIGFNHEKVAHPIVAHTPINK